MRFKNVIVKSASSLCYSLQRSGLVNSDKGKGFRILLYHSIDDPCADDAMGLRVSPEGFFKQMEFLHTEGYEVRRLEELFGYVRRGEDMPSGAVAITFDDGYKDLLKNAVPVLQKFSFEATVFIVPDYVDGKKHDNGNYWERWGYLTREDLKQLRGLGISIGSHSISHSPLAKLAPEVMEHEATSSKKRLEEALETPVRLFSYPHGSVNQKLKAILRQVGYTAACSSFSGKNDLTTDLFEAKRTEIGPGDGIFEFRKKLNGCYDWITGFKRGRGRR